MALTPHDLLILRLATRDAEGRLTFYIAGDGTIALVGKGTSTPVSADDSLPRLEELGLLLRERSRSYVLTPQGWDALGAAEAS